MTDILTASPFHSRPPVRAGSALALTAAADFLLFDQPVGLSLLLFATLLAAGIAASNAAPGSFSLRTCLLVPFGLAPLFETISGLSVSIASLSLIAFALAVSGQLRASLAGFVQQALSFTVTAPFRLPVDFVCARMMATRMGRGVVSFAGLAKWLMPAVLAAIFVGLFSAANPIVEHWLSLVDLWALLDRIEFPRVIFWTAVLLLVWAFLRPRLPSPLWKAKRAPSPAMANVPPAVDPQRVARAQSAVFGKAAILRALLVFNVIFAVQTALDAAYLWGGVALPDGMTYAEYAHRGAYPLIVTALLAAAFVLIVMRAGSETSSDSFIRKLVYLWTLQNVVLVLSSILRLDLYVGTYALTYWRVAAFIWMGLVLIMARIHLRQSSSWLVGANLLALSATLYACSFINVADMIARYNVERSSEMNGGGHYLDVDYLVDLGSAALPAIDRYLGAIDAPPCGDVMTGLRISRDRLADDHAQSFSEWRAWTFRDWRLSRYLAANPVPPVRLCPQAN